MYDKKEIIEKYTKLKSVWKVAKEVGCCGQYVHEVLIKNNVEMSRKKFSKDDEAFLLKNYDKYRGERRLQDLASELGRTKQFICRKAAGLGLTKNNKRKYYKLDLRGRRFGKLTGVRPVGKNNSNGFDWEFLCDCGNSVIICGTSVFLGHTKSCGCLQRDKIGEAARTHGLSKSRIYKIHH